MLVAALLNEPRRDQRRCEKVDSWEPARFARDIGLREPFFVVEVSEDKNGATSVSTREGDYACSLLGSCYLLNYTGDVKRWLNGDSSCGNPTEPII